jgi:hypothetical protein
MTSHIRDLLYILQYNWSVLSYVTDGKTTRICYIIYVLLYVFVIHIVV